MPANTKNESNNESLKKKESMPATNTKKKRPTKMKKKNTNSNDKEEEEEEEEEEETLSVCRIPFVGNANIGQQTEAENNANIGQQAEAEGNANFGKQTEAENNANIGQQAEGNASQSLFDEISDEVMATIPEVTTDDMPNITQSQGNAVADDIQNITQNQGNNVVGGNNAVGVKKKSMKKKPLHVKRRRSNERIKMNWFKKPIVGVGSSSDQPIEVIEPAEGVLTQEDSAKLGTCFRAMKSWKNIKKK
ncbi:hypothetical protein TSUD_287300 [Trifolium subterraneum]|uniref:Uncharacterized protein n=1 Tax=Trifolium subterraneum TaxID=3900 RepID=A0A2Z6PFB1_TRISU|nr:hypothetical protein TSUD_287300 [Trifolium subterraneum]